MKYSLTDEHRRIIRKHPTMRPSRLAALLGVSTQAVGAYQRLLIGKREQEISDRHAETVLASAPSLRKFHNARGEAIYGVAESFIAYAHRHRRRVQKGRNVCQVVRSHNPSGLCVELRYTLRSPVRPYLAE